MFYGATTNAPIQGADTEAAKAGAFSVAKLMYHHQEEDVTALRQAGIPNFICRVEDSYTQERGFISPQAYVDIILQTILRFYGLGARWFQIDNEPNVAGMWDRLGYGPGEYSLFMRQVMGLLRPSLPAGCKLISPPLCFAPKYWHHDADNPTPNVLDDWFACFMQTNFGSIKLPSLYSLFDAVGANVYWQSEHQLIDPSFGAAYDTVRGKAGGLPVVVLEFGASYNWVYDDDGQRKYTDEQVHAMRVADYQTWVRQANQSDYVQAAIAFIMPGGTPDWQGFAIDQEIAGAMAKGMRALRADPGPPVEPGAAGGGPPRAE